MSNEETSGDITITDFRLYPQALIIKLAWYCHKKRHMDKWNQVEKPEINPHIYELLILYKEDKIVQGKKEIFFKKWCWYNSMPIQRRSQIDLYLSPCKILKHKWHQHKSTHTEP